MERPRIGLALGSGAARGLAHIGVLKALRNADIQVDMIAGSSAGALIGALYCCGADFDMVEQIVREIPRNNLLDLSVPRKGFIKGNKIEELIRLITKNKNIEELEIPFKAVAVDLVKGEKVVIDRGPLYKAVRASISIPGIFVPVIQDDMVLVDGGIVDRVPVSTVREMGADIVIGVDVGFSKSRGKVESIFDVIFQSLDITNIELLKNRIIDADILIKPYLPNIDPSRFDQVDECSAEGYAAAEAAVTEIKKMISEMAA
jgi:Predicted esterase of the alpha-beta hydrolase superfamily